jgi:hypothetical protein
MSELILKLFLAHVLGDFVFQKQTWVLDKERYNFKSKYLYLHVVVHVITLLILFQGNPAYWIIYFASLLSHFMIDGFKSLFLTKARNKLLLFFIDQVLHGMVILALVNHYTPFEQSFWQTFQIINKPVILLFSLFSILVTFVSGIIIKQILKAV